MWVWPSTKPGATTWPSASSVSRPRSRIRPIDTMRPCRTPTSARKPGNPEPSITVPFLITRSYGMGSSLTGPQAPAELAVSYPTRAGCARFARGGQRVAADGVQTTLTSAASRAAAVGAGCDAVGLGDAVVFGEAEGTGSSWTTTSAPGSIWPSVRRSAPRWTLAEAGTRTTLPSASTSCWRAVSTRATVPMRVSGARTVTGAAPRTSTRSPGLSACTLVAWYTAVRSVARNTRPSLSVIVPEEASTEATVPVASTTDVPVAVPGGDEGAAAPATWILLTSPFTPLTALAICAA